MAQEIYLFGRILTMLFASNRSVHFDPIFICCVILIGSKIVYKNLFREAQVSLVGSLFGRSPDNTHGSVLLAHVLPLQRDSKREYC